MKHSTLKAKLALDSAAANVEEAIRQLEISREEGPAWLVRATMDRTKQAQDSLEIAHGHAKELIESEIDGSYQNVPDFMEKLS